MVSIFVSYFPSVISKFPQKVPLEKVISDFKSGLYAYNVKHVRSMLRSYGDKAYRNAKRGLPAIAFCGVFSGGHRAENLVHYNGLLVFDIDHLSESEMFDIRQKMSGDDYILSFWESPSGSGFKGLIKLSFLNVSVDVLLKECYKKAFVMVSEYFFSKYGINIDKSCSDYTRLCYVCWDEHLYFNNYSLTFDIDCSKVEHCEKEAKRNESSADRVRGEFKLVNIKGRNSSRSRKIIASIIKYLSKRNLSITCSYDEWLRVGFAIANTFNYDLGLKYFLELSRLDKNKFNELQCIEKLQECYKHGNCEISLGTIIKMAQEKGYVYEKGSSEDS